MTHVRQQARELRGARIEPLAGRFVQPHGVRAYPRWPARVRPVRAPPTVQAGILQEVYAQVSKRMYLGCTCTT